MSKISGNERAKQAIAFHDRGFNCAQSVACAFTDKTGMDEKTLFRITEGLGLGMGCMDATCGAISAAAVLSGLKCSTGHTLKAFLEKNGSLTCRELRGEDTGTPLRSCPGCIEDAVQIIDGYLFPEE